MNKIVPEHYKTGGSATTDYILKEEKPRPFIYVCSPLQGDVERNIQKAIGYSRYVYDLGGIPLAPHVIFTSFLDDNMAAERKAGVALGLALLTKCDELWAFGDQVSEGMAGEIKAAGELGLRVKRFNSKVEVEDIHEA